MPSEVDSNVPLSPLLARTTRSAAARSRSASTAPVIS
jgi:hypothetical protein